MAGVPKTLQLILLAILCALLTLILGGIALLEAFHNRPMTLPASLTAFAGVAYTALFGHGVFTLAQGSQLASQQTLLGLTERLAEAKGEAAAANGKATSGHAGGEAPPASSGGAA